MLLNLLFLYYTNNELIKKFFYYLFLLIKIDLYLSKLNYRHYRPMKRN